jgi:membrane protease YdiL (CAAX protease family)
LQENRAPSEGRTISVGGLRLDVRVTAILVLSTLLLTLDAYHRFIPATTAEGIVVAKALERVVYYLAIPLLVITLVFRESPAEFGFSLGDWRQGLKWTGILIALSLPILLLVARLPGMTAYYDRYPGAVRTLIPTAALDLIGWEFFFRGFLLFGLMRLMGPTAVVAQAVPFALAHIGKPEIEAWSTIFGGTVFGWLAWKSRSFVYPFLLHWFIYTATVLVAQA